MNIKQYKAALKAYRPAARNEKDYIKRATARDEWRTIMHHSRKTAEHQLAYAAYIMEGKR